MNKTSIISVLLSLYFSFSAFAEKIELNPRNNGFNITEQATDGLTVKSSINDLNVFRVKTKEGVFIQLQVDKFTKNNDYGNPHLPIINKLVEIPYCSGIKVEIISYNEEVINLNEIGYLEKIIPVQPSLSKSADPSEVEFQYNKDFYEIDDFNNGPNVNTEILGIMRGTQVGRISISQFSYNPVQNILKIYNDIEVKITFENINLSKTNSLKDKNYSPMFEYTLSKHFINHISNKSKDVITTYPVKYVIVSDPMFETQLQAFIEWKTRKGFNVIEAYTNDPLVGTTTTSIKSYLQDLYNAGTPSDPPPTYVLFVGDVAQIPTFDGTAGSHKTDLYYCEYDGGGDVFSEIYYGRFSATNTSELQPQIDKTLQYEQYLMPDPSFLGEVILVAGVDAGNAPTYGNGQINYGTDNYFNATHGVSSHTYLYGSGSPITSNDPAASAAIQANFSEGVGFVNYTAHCGSSGWGDPSFVVSDVANLTNQDKYPLSIGNCCSSNTFFDPVCFGEALLRAVDKGAIGHIGGSNSTYWDEDYWWGVGATAVSANPVYDAHLGAFDCLFHENGETLDQWFYTNGQIIYSGNLAVAEGNGDIDYYCEIYHLMGDPSVMTYIGVPPAISASYINPIPVGTSSLMVTTEQYAYVAISQNNVLLDAQFTGTNTSITLTFPAFVSPGQADIVVTKQDREPYIGTLDVVNNNTQNDAQLMNIIYPESYNSILSADVTPKVVIRNMGLTNLTTADVGYQIDGGTITSTAWAGNLAQYETDTVTYSLITLPSGNHIFTAFTSNPNGVADEYNPGDTLDKPFIVSSGDAMAQEILGLEEVYCDIVDYTPVVVIKNAGLIDISQIDVNYQIDGGTIITQNWSGNLAPNDIDTITFPQITLTIGNHTFEAFTSSPNGGTDENTSNDMIDFDYSVFDDAQDVEVNIVTDYYGSEVTWEITDDVTSAILYSGGPYTDWTVVTDNQSFCLGIGCYTFNIYDSYGDGMDAYSTGTYSVTNTTISLEYGSGSGDFGFGASIQFCITPVDVKELFVKDMQIFPNPVKDILTLKFNNSNTRKLEIIDILGKTIVNREINENTINIDMSEYSNGIYHLNIVEENNTITKKIVVAK